MSSFLKISEAASLAFHAMLFITDHPNGPASAKNIASALSVSEAHMAKVLQRLAKVGLVRSARGPKGGFQLGKPAATISLLEIYETIEGPIRIACCLFERPVCDGTHCIFGGVLPQASVQFRDYLAGKVLYELSKKGRFEHVDPQENHPD